MSNFWSNYIIAIVALNIFGCAWLLMWTRKMDLTNMPEDGTTGHEYDGIREYNNPLPRWWLMLFWITIAFSIIYLFLYPGLGKFQGYLGWTSVGEHAQADKQYNEQYGKLYAGYAKVPMTELVKDERAMKIGARLFANNCSACHGTNARGAVGFPNLTDSDWLYGGTPEHIYESILNGRNAGMPAWIGTLGEDGIEQVANYVLSLSGRKADAKLAAIGQEKFAVCAACHGADGKGNQMIGAPNLTDNIWLYGGSLAAVKKTLTEGRAGKMPAQNEILGAERVHLLSAYVYSLSNSKK